MSSIKKSLIAMVIGGVVTLSACGSDSNPPVVVEPPPPPPPAPVSFSGFVKDQFAATADDTDPEEVDGIDFEFDADDDPDAFDDLL